MSLALSRGDVVLVPFPFTDLSGGKMRPALVVNTVGEDILVSPALQRELDVRLARAVGLA